ncbi:MAG TPA: Ig-like domain-containing protein, partial [Thermoanaerobaculia bacterium]
NNALFSVQPSIAPNGTLTYTPAANANGSAVVTVTLTDDGGTANGGVNTSATQSFTITVSAVNDDPSFTGGGDVTVLEDSGAYSAAWATSISAGPADESAQTVSFNVSNDNSALFASQPAISASGVLTFTPFANAFGSANVTVTLSDNAGGSSSAQTFTITVGAVNDAPSFTAGGNVTVNEDAAAYSAAWASAISAGPSESQNVTFSASNDNNSLFSTQPSVSPAGVLSFALAANANGSANVTVTLLDDGGTANGGVDTAAAQSFTITVNAINDAPGFTSGGDVTVNEDSGAYSAAWATAISAGAADEASQTLSFSTFNTNNSLFAVQPAVAADGTLTFTLAANAFGSATVTVQVSDDGGTANGGADTSAPQSFTIHVTAVNDAPSFTAGGNVTVAEDSGVYSASWATGLDAGAGESGQAFTFNVSNDNSSLFASQPSIDANGILSFTPAPNANGVATITVSLSDNGGTANGGVDTSASVTFVISVSAVNDAPSFVKGADQSLLEDSG